MRASGSLFVGFPPAPATRAAPSPTYSGKPTLTTLNGVPVGSTASTASTLGALGVPVGMVAGDDAWPRGAPPRAPGRSW
jgi:D-aminopeptidase